MRLFISTINPRILFLTDAVGAAISAIFLGMVLVLIQEEIGLPVVLLRILSVIAIAMAVYSFTCYCYNVSEWRAKLKLIAVVNLLYCGLTASTVLHHWESMQYLGILYFCLEIIIIVTVAIVEFSKARDLVD